MKHLSLKILNKFWLSFKFFLKKTLSYSHYNGSLYYYYFWCQGLCVMTNWISRKLSSWELRQLEPDYNCTYFVNDIWLCCRSLQQTSGAIPFHNACALLPILEKGLRRRGKKKEKKKWLEEVKAAVYLLWALQGKSCSRLGLKN